MTDKQMHSKNLSVELDKSRTTATSLIIDGVDVSRCSDISGHVNDFGEYECLCRCIFGDGSDDYGVIGHEMCKDNPNCHYKNWQRKEKECEAFKKGVQMWRIECGEKGNEIVALHEELAVKKQECEKAKQNAQDTYDLWQALIESFNILQGEKIKLEQECEQQKAKFELFKTSNQTTINQLKAENDALFKAIEEVNKINKRLEKEKIELQIQLQNQKHESCHFDKIKEITGEM